jgi:hypothetical protein
LEVVEIKADGKAVWKQLEENGQKPHVCNKKQEEEQKEEQQPLSVYEQLIKIQRKLDLLQESVELVLKKK